MSHGDHGGVDEHSADDGHSGGGCNGQCALLDLLFSTDHHHPFLLLLGDAYVGGDYDHNVLLGGGEKHYDRSDCLVQGSSLCFEHEES